MRDFKISAPKGNIYLIGFMATGKSKVGLILAELLGWKFIDTDEEIAKNYGSSIAEIFSEKGEPFFRQLEMQTIDHATRLRAHVVALGGGAIMNDENWEKISHSGLTIRLKASPEVILARTMHKEDRPLLLTNNHDEKLKRIKAIMAAREPYYARADLHFISTEEESPESVAKAILKKLIDIA